MKIIFDQITLTINSAEDLIQIKKTTAVLEEWQKSILDVMERWYDTSTSMGVHTSGSTGDPKYIVHSKVSMAQSAYNTIHFLQLSKGINAGLCLPSQAISGMMMIVRAILGDWNLHAIKPSVDIQPFIGVDMDFIALTPPQMHYSINKHLDFTRTIKTIIIGGAQVSALLLSAIKGLPCRVFETYGMTETITHVALRPLNGSEEDGLFSALPDIHFACDKDSALIINVAYLDVKRIFTNDIVKLHSPYRFEWLGRRDNVVNSGGIKLYPEKIETRLSALVPFPFFITSETDDKLGQKLVMIVQMKNSEILPFKKEDLAAVLDKYEIPKAYYGVEVFAKTLTSKILRSLELYPDKKTLRLIN